MRIINRQVKANETLQKWEHQYGLYKEKYKEIKLSTGKSTVEIYHQLKVLGNNPNPDDIDKIIGNNSWTSVPKCQECKTENLPYVIELELNDDEYFIICQECLNKALNLIESNNRKNLS